MQDAWRIQTEKQPVRKGGEGQQKWNRRLWAQIMARTIGVELIGEAGRKHNAVPQPGQGGDREHCIAQARVTAQEGEGGVG